MKVLIDNIAYGGFGIGRIDGKAIFVDYALPGDELEVEIYDEKKNYSFAKILRIIKQSEKRIESPCPNFGICGGCSYLNLNYSDEIEFKKIILKDQLQRIASVELETDINIITNERFNSRSHASIKCGEKITGFYEKNSNNIIEFPDKGCLLLAHSLNDCIKSLNIKEFKGDLKIAENSNQEFHYNLIKQESIDEVVGEFRYKRSINNFFQSNKFLRNKMSELVCSYSDLTGNDEFADICAGCGFFTIPLSKKAKKGTGYDIDKVSIQYARINAELNNCTNLKFYSLPESEINPGRLNPKSIIVDPPRSGISKRGRKTINSINPEIIVYVSCNPSTFSRDIKDFIKNNYLLEEITMIDMFPCTHHIEIVSKLVKNHR